MCIWRFWLSICFGIKSRNIDLNSWDTCIYVFTSVCMYVCMYASFVRMYVYICIYMCVYVCTNMCMYVLRLYICTCVCNICILHVRYVYILYRTFQKCVPPFESHVIVVVLYMCALRPVMDLRYSRMSVRAPLIVWHVIEWQIRTSRQPLQRRR
jgi:hypothetical protein